MAVPYPFRVGAQVQSAGGWPTAFCRLCSLLAALATLVFAVPAGAQTDTSVSRPDYRNEVFDPVLTNSQGTSLTQALSIAIYSGSVGDGTNSASSLRTNTPNDGVNYLVQSIIGQPVGAATVPFALFTTGVGTITPVPDMYAATNWYQSGQSVTLIAKAGRYYAFANWLDTSDGTQRVVTVTSATNFTAVFTNTVALATNVIRGVTRIAQFGTPLLLFDGVYYSNNVVPAAVGAQFQMSITNSFPGGSNYYSVNGSAFTLFTTSVLVTAPFSVQSEGRTHDGSMSVPGDTVNTLSRSSPGGGTVTFSSQSDFYTGAASATLTPSASNGWTFLNWEGDASGTDTNLRLAMNSPKVVRAIFGTPVVTQASGSSGASGSVQRVPDLQLYPYGTTNRFTAVPDSVSYFSDWGGALNGVTENPVDLVVTNASQTNVAHFFPLGNNKSSLTIFRIGNGTVSTSPAHSPQGWFYNSGATVALTATPDPGQSFTGWSGDTNYAGAQVTLLMSTNRFITASFAPAQPVFLLSSANYEVNEGNQLVSITVSNIGAFCGKVSLSTSNGSAIGGNGDSADYAPVTNLTLLFTSGPSAITNTILITDRFLSGTDKTFYVSLSNPLTNGCGTNAAASLASPSTATVTIHYNDTVTATGSELTQAYPDAAPGATGSLQLFLTEDGTNVPAAQ